MITTKLLLALAVSQTATIAVPQGELRLAWVVEGGAPQVLELRGKTSAELDAGDGCLAIVGAGSAPRWARLSLPRDVDAVAELWRGEAAASATGTVGSEDPRSFPPVVRLRQPETLADGCWAALEALRLTEFQVDWDGSFTAGPMAAGRWRLELAAPFHRAVEREVVLRAGETLRLEEVRLAPVARLAVRVEPNGAVPPFRLEAARWLGTPAVPGGKRWHWEAEAEIEEDAASLELEPGRYRLTLRGAGGASLREEQELSVGENELLLRLEPIVVSGTVLRGDEPVAGVKLAMAGGRSRAETVSEDDGSYTVALWEGGRWMVEATAPDRGPDVLLLDLGTAAPGDRIERDLVLAGRVLEGVVRGAGELQPVAGAELVARQDTQGGQVFTSLTTDREGRFRLPLKEQGNLRLKAEAEGYLATTRTFVGEPPDAVLEIVLEPGVTVSGQVLDAAGGPVAGAWVVEGPQDPRAQAERSAASDGDGRFTFTCRPGSVLWAVSSGHAVAWARVQPEVRMVLGPAPPVSELEVVLPGGKPAVRAPLSFATGDGVLAPLTVLDRAARLQQRSARTDEEGRIEVGTMPAGVYTATLLTRRGPLPLGTVTLPTAPQRLEVELPPAGT